MSDRTFDIELECGCMYSADGGGGCIPCHYETITDDDKVQADKCREAHIDWHCSPEYDQFQKDCIERNK